MTTIGHARKRACLGEDDPTGGRASARRRLCSQPARRSIGSGLEDRTTASTLLAEEHCGDGGGEIGVGPGECLQRLLQLHVAHERYSAAGLAAELNERGRAKGYRRGWRKLVVEWLLQVGRRVSSSMGASQSCVIHQCATLPSCHSFCLHPLTAPRTVPEAHRDFGKRRTRSHGPDRPPPVRQWRHTRVPGEHTAEGDATESASVRLHRVKAPRH